MSQCITHDGQRDTPPIYTLLYNEYLILLAAVQHKNKYNNTGAAK
jgi:hypothetical protein